MDAATRFLQAADEFCVWIQHCDEPARYSGSLQAIQSLRSVMEGEFDLEIPVDRSVDFDKRVKRSVEATFHDECVSSGTGCARSAEATSHDEYVSSEKRYLRYWFVCMAGGSGWECMTAILSKKWKRKFQDPSTPKNKYKCCVCTANYKTVWGVIIEYSIDGKLYYFRAPIPDEDTLDIKALDIERKVKDNSSAIDIYNSLPMIPPTTTSLVRPIDVEQGTYKLPPRAEYKEIPLWSWPDVLAFAG